MTISMAYSHEFSTDLDTFTYEKSDEVQVTG